MYDLFYVSGLFWWTDQCDYRHSISIRRIFRYAIVTTQNSLLLDRIFRYKNLHFYLIADEAVPRR
jgi:hypothetical protein